MSESDAARADRYCPACKAFIFYYAVRPVARLTGPKDAPQLIELTCPECGHRWEREVSMT